jgi:peroxiredoxin Q/BCP
MLHFSNPDIFECSPGAVLYCGRRIHYVMADRLKPGDIAPAFRKPSTNGMVDLASFLGNWVILYFYPKDFTSGCTIESCDFRDQHEELDGLVLGVSPDPVTSHEKFRAEHSLPFDLIADENHSLAAKYGAWGEKKNYGRTFEGLIRSTFIISPEGQIAEAMYNVKARGHVARVKERLDSLKA